MGQRLRGSRQLQQCQCGFKCQPRPRPGQAALLSQAFLVGTTPRPS